MPTLTQVGKDKKHSFVRKIFQNWNRWFEEGNLRLFKKIGNGYFDDVNALLKKENAVDALNFIEEAESGRH